MNNTAFLLGTATSVPAAPFLDAAQLNAAVGNNVGNLAFAHAIDQHLGGGLPRLRRLEKLATINAMDGIAVLPCANHLGAHTDLSGEAKHFEGIQKPMVAVGLGAQANSKMVDLPDLPEGSQRWLRTLADHAPGSPPNISVRGDYTLRVMEKYGVADRAVVLGCPTLFINPSPTLGQQICAGFERPIRRVAVAAGHYRWKHMWKLESSLARLAEQTHGAYILQSPLDMLKVYRGEGETLADEVLMEMRDSISSPDCVVDVNAWYQRYAIAFFDIPAWMNYLRGFDFVIGARIHGVMLALQAGVPGVCVAHDSRTLELCQTMGVPYVETGEVADGVDLQSLKSLFRFDPDAFDLSRRHLALRYAEFLVGNGLAPHKDLRTLGSPPGQGSVA